MTICNISGVGPPSSNFSDPCVNNAGIGAVYINTSNRDVFIRTKVSVPSLAGDFEDICSVISGCTVINATDVAFDDTLIPVNCNQLINAATVSDAIIQLACAIRVPSLNIMAYTYTGPCALTLTPATNLQGLFNDLLCRDEEILAKTFGWGIAGDATRTISEGASGSDVLMRTGNVIIGSTSTQVTNAKLAVAGTFVSGSLGTLTMGGSNNGALAASSAVIDPSTSNSAIVASNSATINDTSARSAIIAGESGIITGVNSIISGGLSNVILAGASQTAITGGTSNQVGGTRTAILGGISNTAKGTNSVVTGGESNYADGTNNGILAGFNNLTDVSALRNAIIGSQDCRIEVGVGSSIQDVIAAGFNNEILGATNSAIIAALASGQYTSSESAILGGNQNAINDAANSVILGGNNNSVNGSNAVIIGGANNTTAVGANNSAIIYGDTNVVTSGTSLAGGSQIATDASYSIGLGRHVDINSAHSGTFLWQCNHTSDFTSAAANEFAIKPHGGVRIRTNTAGTVGVDLAAGGSSWVAVSSKKVKDNFNIVNTKVLLEKLKNLDIFSFNYKKDLESDAVYSDINLGTTAEQWDAAFGEFFTPKTVKNSDGVIAGISYMDAIGVLLGAVKQLTLEIEDLKNEYTRISCQAA